MGVVKTGRLSDFEPESFKDLAYREAARAMKTTPNPQEKQYIGSIGGVPIISDPKATEPHFRAPLASDPQESSPGFTTTLDDTFRELFQHIGTGSARLNDLHKQLAAAHQKEIQAAKREGMQQARNVLHNHGWYDACATLDQMIKRELEEETIS